MKTVRLAQASCVIVKSWRIVQGFHHAPSKSVRDCFPRFALLYFLALAAAGARVSRARLPFMCEDHRVGPKLQKLSRLGDMSWDELRTRARQELNKRLDLARYRAGLLPHTNGGSQKPCRDPQFFFSREDVPRLAALLRQMLPKQVEQILSEAGEICAHRFRLLGYDPIDYGPQIDWHLDAVHNKRAAILPWYKVPFLDFDLVGDHKIIWELSRHQHLVTLAKAWVVSGNDRYVAELTSQWYAWQAANPFGMGINWSSSLEISLRSLSWLWVHFLLSDCPAVPLNFARDLVQALALNGKFIEHYLSTYFSPNTHLLGEALGLFFIGTLSPQIPAAEGWQRLGWNILVREAEHQVLSDGVYFERSLYYHVYALDFFLHARVLAKRSEIEIPSRFDATIQKMLEVIRTLSHAGPPHGFGDDDGGRLFNPRRNRSEHLMDPLALGAALYGIHELASTASLTEEAIWLFGDSAVSLFAERPPSPQLKTAAFENAGIYVTANSDTPAQLVMHAGPLGRGTSGHAHADALAVTLSLDGRQWLVDSGAHCYVGPTDERNSFRGTRAHNTVIIDGLDQSLPKGSFSWDSVADVEVETWLLGETFSYLRAKHDGFARLPDPVSHRRSVFHLHGLFWFVRDLLDGCERHSVEILWHFGSDVTLTEENDIFIASQPGSGARLALIPSTDSGLSSQADSCEISVAYGRKQLAALLSVAGQVQLPAECGTLIIPLTEFSGQPAKLGRLEAGKGLCAYRYAQPSGEHLMLFSVGPEWTFGPFASDANFVYFRVEHGRTSHFIFCGGSFIEVDGKNILSLRHNLERFEWLHESGGERRKAFSSEDGAGASFAENALRYHDLTKLLTPCAE